MSRTLHGITWQDNLAWMEEMKGAAWGRVLQEERQRFRRATQGKQALAKQIAKELTEASAEFQRPLFETRDVSIAEEGTLSLNWAWKGGNEWRQAAALQNQGGWVWEVAESGDGSESYSCRAWTSDHKEVWEYKGIGPFVGIVGNRCYLQEVKLRLVNWRLLSVDARTGGDVKILYEETDPRYNLELLQASEDCIFVKRQAGERCDLIVVDEKGVRFLGGIGIGARQYVLGKSASEILTWEEGKGWQVSAGIKHRLPSFTGECVPETLDTGRNLLVTRWKGCRTLWKISRRDSPLLLWKGVGQIKLDSWDGPWVRLDCPDRGTLWWSVLDTAPPRMAPASVKCFETKEGVPYFVLGPAKPKALLCVAYGAYGLPTHLSITRWRPLLKRGWAISIGLLRGGGDHTPEWEHSGRVKGRALVLKEAEGWVREVQERMECPSGRTVVYGRSAGGLWAGGLVAKHPKGDLAGCAYMEVPYLDVLRTTTNPTLPLTLIETDDFGLPAARLSDFVTMLEWSPMELLALHAGEGTSGVKQLVRTGLNDPQVYAYESMKWIRRCRGTRAGTETLLAIEGDQGHFVHGDLGLFQRAMDLAILLEMIKK